MEKNERCYLPSLYQLLKMLLELSKISYSLRVAEEKSSSFKEFAGFKPIVIEGCLLEN